MAQRHDDDSQRSREDFRRGGRGDRPEPDEDQHGRERQPGGSRHTLRDDDVPDVRFGRNLSEGGEFSGGGERDFIDETSRGQHSGYGDYGQQDYRGQSGGQRGGEGQRFGGRRERDFRRGDQRGSISPGGSGYGGSQFGSESRYSGQGRTYGGGYQSFRGRGPRGYTRSDERLREIICEMLTDADDIDASDIEVTVTEAVVLLDGSVVDRWTKYQTEEMAGQVPGVKDVRNQLRVHASGTSTGDRKGG